MSSTVLSANDGGRSRRARRTGVSSMPFVLTPSPRSIEWYQRSASTRAWRLAFAIAWVLPGFRQRLAWEQVVAHRRVVHEARDDHGGLFHVVGRRGLVHIQVRVMRARFVVERVLHEL